MVEPLRHRQPKGAATDMFYLQPPRHISTLPILLQKSSQRFCEIRIGNNRIDVGEYLNQCCESASQLESILRGRMGKIFLQQYRGQSGLVVLAVRFTAFDRYC